MTLIGFREGLQQWIGAGCTARPFVCDGSPLACRAFIVGFNAATAMPRPFWHYWDDAAGFRRELFAADYAALGKRKGNRRVIEILSDSLLPCLETNLYPTPTPRARGLADEDRKTDVFEFLFDTIRPRLVFAHSKPVLVWFRERTGLDAIDETPRETSWRGHAFRLAGRSGPLYTMSSEDADELGRALAAAPGPGS